VLANSPPNIIEPLLLNKCFYFIFYIDFLAKFNQKNLQKKGQMCSRMFFFNFQNFLNFFSKNFREKKTWLLILFVISLAGCCQNVITREQFYPFTYLPCRYIYPIDLATLITYILPYVRITIDPLLINFVLSNS